MQCRGMGWDGMGMKLVQAYGMARGGHIDSSSAKILAPPYLPPYGQVELRA